MTPGRVLLAVGIALGACATLSGQDLAIRVSADATAVEFGEPLEVVVERAWIPELQPEPLDEAALDPLVVRLQGVDLREEGGRVIEARRYEARSFLVGEVTVSPPFIRARPLGGGAQRIAIADELTLAVTSSLPEGAAGVVELPGGLAPRPVRWSRRVGVVLLIGLGLALLARWARRRSRAALAVTDRRDVTGRARARLSALRGAEVRGADEVRRFGIESSELLREFVREQFGLAIRPRATEELTEMPGFEILAKRERTSLIALLGFGDRMKFAGWDAPPEERDGFLDGIGEFIEVADGRREPEESDS